MLTIKNKKLFFLVLLLYIFCGWFTLYNLKDHLLFFYTPTDLITKKIKQNETLKLGGMVMLDSIHREGDSITFTVTDFQNDIKVIYKGTPPTLFKEKAGVVAIGKKKDEYFYATEILAKHDEKYMPLKIKKNT